MKLGVLNECHLTIMNLKNNMIKIKRLLIGLVLIHLMNSCSKSNSFKLVESLNRAKITIPVRNEFLNKLTHFDLRLKKFPDLTMAQTLVARIDCAIYRVKNKYLITCNKSFEEYFKERLKDTGEIN